MLIIGTVLRHTGQGDDGEMGIIGYQRLHLYERVVFRYEVSETSEGTVVVPKGGWGCLAYDGEEEVGVVLMEDDLLYDIKNGFLKISGIEKPFSKLSVG